MLYAHVCMCSVFFSLFSSHFANTRDGRGVARGSSAETGKWRNPTARTITGIENIEAKATENKSWQHVSLVDFTGRRTAFYFCFAPIIDELWALPSFLSLLLACSLAPSLPSRRPAGRSVSRVDVIRHCLHTASVREGSHSYPVTPKHAFSRVSSRSSR